MNVPDETHAPRSPTHIEPHAVGEFLVLTCAMCARNYRVRQVEARETMRCPACSGTLAPLPIAGTLDGSDAAPTTPERVGPAAPDPEGVPFGRYRLLSELGRGAMGVVWKAWDPQLRRTVALKQVLGGPATPDRIERFHREGQLAAKLRHPNIVAVHDVGVHEGQHYLTTDFVQGTTLEARLQARPPLRQGLTWIRAVAEALAYAHGQGVIHRDIKPANILVDGQDRPLVTDFGLAKDINPEWGEGERTRLTVTGNLLGTPRYMSPEQARGKSGAVGPAPRGRQVVRRTGA